VFDGISQHVPTRSAALVARTSNPGEPLASSLLFSASLVLDKMLNRCVSLTAATVDVVPHASPMRWNVWANRRHATRVWFCQVVWCVFYSLWFSWWCVCMCEVMRKIKEMRRSIIKIKLKCSLWCEECVDKYVCHCVIWHKLELRRVCIVLWN
jgi:hypothetical protein